MIRSNQDHHALSMDEKVATACRDAGQQVIEIAERTGTEIVIWRDGSKSVMTKPAEDWFEALSAEQAPLLNALRELVLAANPEFEEAIKWGQPCYSAHSLVCYLNKFKSHVVLGFQQGAHLSDPKALLEGGGKDMRHVKVRHREDVDKSALRALIKEAIKFDRDAHARIRELLQHRSNKTGEDK